MIKKLRTAAKLGLSGSVGVLQDRVKARLARSVRATARRVTGQWLTFHLRPVSAADVGTWSDLGGDLVAGTVIVLQGPVIEEDDFTLETVKIYQKIFRGTPIIVSTWNNTRPALVASLRSLGVEVLQSATPPYRGYGNVNYQIVSTTAGLKRAKALGYTWAVKTRTDQRIHAPTALGFLKGLLETFPPPASMPSRLVVTGLTRKYKLYHLSDMFHFGHIDTLLAYWDAPHDTREFVEADMEHNASSFQRISRMMVCEAYLFSSFLSRAGEAIEGTLQHSWRMIAKYTVVIDRESLDLFWPKYRPSREYRDRVYHGISLFAEVPFSEWLLFYRGFVDRMPHDHDALVLSPDGLVQRDASLGAANSSHA